MTDGLGWAWPSVQEEFGEVAYIVYELEDNPQTLMRGLSEEQAAEKLLDYMFQEWDACGSREAVLVTRLDSVRISATSLRCTTQITD